MPAYWGIPDNPKTAYYRAGSMTLPPDSGASFVAGVPRKRTTSPKRFFHFIVPMEPPLSLDADRVARYRREIEGRGRPVALGVSVLDVHAPAVAPWDKADDPTYESAEHWCLATYLLDGHHKVEAASLANGTVGMLAFISRDASIASDEDIDAGVHALDEG